MGACAKGKEGGEWEEFGEENWGSREVVFEEEWGFVKSEKKGEKLFLEVRKRSQKSQKMVFIRELWKVPKSYEKLLIFWGLEIWWNSEGGVESLK